jgi:predicted transposase/invertase (TIGR01784 family)
MKRNQIFGIPTYDSLFKWVLSADSIRPSFFHAFIPDINIQSSERLDDHMNPLQELQLLRRAIHDKGITELVLALQQRQAKMEVHVADSYHDRATDLFKTIISHFDDIRYSFPQVPFDGKMDFVCKLDSGEYALVEMQILPEDFWDQRALGYVAGYFGNQLRKGASWKDIRKVIGVNILGGGRDEAKHWPDTPEQYVRYYKFQEQMHKEIPPRFLEGLDIIQYSLANVPDKIDSQEQKDWLCFFKSAQNMSEEDVKNKIKTPAVFEAFERAKLTSLPEKVREGYRNEEVMHENLSTHIAKQKAEGRQEGREEGRQEERAKAKAEKVAIARALLEKGMEMSAVQAITELSEQDILQ